MRKHIIGASCPLCKERFYKDGVVSDDELKIDKSSRIKIHVVDDLPKNCSRCGSRLRPIKKYIPSVSKTIS